MKSFSIVCLSVFLGALLNIFLVNAGSNTVMSVAGGKVRTSHVNQYFQALSQDSIPRNSSGVATSEGGSLGSSTFPWKSAVINTGYWQAGDIKCHHTYNGALPIAQGWMLMDGRVINEANYNTEHAAGNWDTYIGSSPIDGKYLPQMTNRYVTGNPTTSQDGSAPITAVGQANNSINIQHGHGINAIQWYQDSGATDDGLFNSAGNAVVPGVDGTTNKNGMWYGACNPGGNPGCIDTNWYTDNTTSNDNLSATQTIRPDSIQFTCYMRIF